MKSRPYYKSTKYQYPDDECEIDDDNELCATDPDLLLLRRNAKDERQAIAFYLTAAAKTTGALSELFIDSARDESIHFRKLMAMVAEYDAVQAQAFKDLGIHLVSDGFRKNHSPSSCAQDRLEIINLLTYAITSELDAINMYQESYLNAEHDDVKALFCNNGNDEKLHLAEFWKALMVFTKESLALP